MKYNPTGLEKFDVPNEPAVMSADDWSDLDWCYEREKWYRIAKSRQEKTAMSYCEDHGMRSPG